MTIGGGVPGGASSGASGGAGIARCDFVVRTTAGDRVLGTRIRPARSVWRRFLGLMGRSHLDEGEGLWLPGDASIHMLFMRFPIDAVFLAAADEPGTWRIVTVREHLRPWRDVVWWVRGAKGCLEVRAGAAHAAGLRPGDTLRFDPA
jgi:uncharacterized protein